MAESKDDGDGGSPGWDAIDQAFAKLYGSQEPKHYGTLIKSFLGGRDPLDGVSIYKADVPAPHWHYVSYGLTELYTKDSDDPKISGWGFELTFRLARSAGDDEPPVWPVNFMQNIARYVFQTGNVFEDGHWMSANGPIASDTDTRIVSMAFVADPQLPAIDTPHGRVEFLQIVGLTEDEELAVKQWRARSLLELLEPEMPLWITDVDRDTFLANASVRAAVEEGKRRDGSSTGFVYVDSLDYAENKRFLRKPRLELTLGARQAAEIANLLPLRLPFEKQLAILGDGKSVSIRPAAKDAYALTGDALELSLSPETAAQFAEVLKPVAGTYALPNCPWLDVKVVKTSITGPDGEVVTVIG